MEYKKIIKDDKTFHIIKTDRFKSVDFVIYFTKKFSKKNIPYYTLLKRNLVYTSKKYNTKNKIAIKGEELYGCSVSTSSMISGALESFIISTSFVNPKYTEESMFKESIDFFYEVLFNPNVEDNKFNEKYYEIIKSDLISFIKSEKDNPRSYAAKKFNEIMFKGLPTAHSNIPTIKQIEEVDCGKLYDFYKELFDGSYKIDVTIYGDIEDSYVDYIEEKFKELKGSDKKFDVVVTPKIEPKVNETVETLHFNQSKLYMGYYLKNFTYHEINHVMKVYNTILGTTAKSLLFTIVRENNSLCYSINSYYAIYSQALVIYAGINRNNYEKTVGLIEECIDKMSDRKIIEPLFEPAKKTINTMLNNYYDDAFSQFDNKYRNEFYNVEDNETLREEINKVTIDEVIELNKKIQLSTIYLLKGDN